jgi:hypothetical protein
MQGAEELDGEQVGGRTRRKNLISQWLSDIIKRKGYSTIFICLAVPIAVETLDKGDQITLHVSIHRASRNSVS